MACATLKRPLDFDPLHSPSPTRPAKRRRCVPHALHNIQHGSPRKSREPSAFDGINVAAGAADFINKRIEQEVLRLQRRRQLASKQPDGPGSPSGGLSSCSGSDDDMIAGPSSPPSPTASMSTSASSNLEAAARRAVTSHASPSHPLCRCLCHKSANVSAAKQDGPMLTFKQANLLCERMVKEAVENVKEMYDEVLVKKLAEQYDSFVKFTHDQIQRKFQDVPMSYVS